LRFWMVIVSEMIIWAFFINALQSPGGDTSISCPLAEGYALNAIRQYCYVLIAKSMDTSCSRLNRFRMVTGQSPRQLSNLEAIRYEVTCRTCSNDPAMCRFMTLVTLTLCPIRSMADGLYWCASWNTFRKCFVSLSYRAALALGHSPSWITN
jgi:hypothetical protein